MRLTVAILLIIGGVTLALAGLLVFYLAPWHIMYCLCPSMEDYPCCPAIPLANNPKQFAVFAILVGVVASGIGGAMFLTKRRAERRHSNPVH